MVTTSRGYGTNYFYPSIIVSRLLKIAMMRGGSKGVLGRIARQANRFQGNTRSRVWRYIDMPENAPIAIMDAEKQEVYEFWNKASCGEALFLSGDTREAYIAHAGRRYELEPFIKEFGEFSKAAGKTVLEIGVGLGADHALWAQAGARLYGIDLTHRAIDHTKRRFKLLQLESNLQQSDAENLPFPDSFFDIVYSWGVLMCSPNPQKAYDEVYRVLKPGGVAKLMIYQKWSIIGYMLWMRYALVAGKPFTPLSKIFPRYLESPGTKAYSRTELRAMLSKFRSVAIRTELCHGDLLDSEAGQRHRGPLLDFARRVWPRWFIRRFLRGHGLFLLVNVTK
jgi:ubiquinone/menaquinone biosynthesis C-methylase UbiE